MICRVAVSRSLLSCALAGAILYCGALTGYAQTEESKTTPDRGLHPSASYASSDIETINTTNGNLMLNIPLASLPQGRSGRRGFTLQLQYNSKIWDGEPDIADDPLNPDRKVAVTWLVKSEEGGWRYNIPELYSYVMEKRNLEGATYPLNDPRRKYIWKLKMNFPDGSARELRPYGYDDPLDDGYFHEGPKAGKSYYSIDGSYLRLDFGLDGWTLNFPDGSRVVKQGELQRSYDRNGNFDEVRYVENYNNTGHKATIIADQLGRSMTIEWGTGEDYIHSTGINGAPITTTVKWGATYVSKTYRAGNHYQFNVKWTDHGVRGVSDIILPSQLNGDLKYSFGYNGSTTKGTGTTSVGWGELSSVTLPSGARTNYQYSMDNESGSLVQAKWVLENSPTRKDLTYTNSDDGLSTAATTETWRYSIVNGRADITSPDGGVTTEWFSPSPNRGRVYKIQRPDGTVIQRVWKQNRPFQPQGMTLPTNIVINPYVETESFSIPDVAGTLVKTAVKNYSYDKNGNVTQVKEYDWVPYGSAPTDAALRRLSTISYYSATPDATDTITDDPQSYYNNSAPPLLNLVASTETGDASVPLTRTEFSYDDPLAKGNVTEQRVWDSTKGALLAPQPDGSRLSPSNSVNTSHQYDQYANRELSIDANGVQTKFIYGDIPGPDGTVAGLYPTDIKSAYNTSVQRITHLEYDFWTGLVTRTTDVDNNLSVATIYDDLGRPKLVKSAESTSAEAHARTDYYDAERRIVMRKDLEVTGDGKVVSVQHYDQLGRVRLARQLEGGNVSEAILADETAGIKVQNRYLYSGENSYTLTSNPYRAATSAVAKGEETMGWTRTKADKVGRVIEVQTFAGNSVPGPWGDNTSLTGTVTTSYDAEYATVTDQAGKRRRSVSDGLGRLVRVDEPSPSNSLDTTAGVPAKPTCYNYDALSHLVEVRQGAPWQIDESGRGNCADNQGQQRTFQYSSISRLTSTTNPESGVTSYGYYPNGNLHHKTDARGVITTYTYDELSRVRTRSYSDNRTPPVTYFYDSDTLPSGAPALAQGQPKGQLLAVTYGGAGSTTGSYFGHDALGRINSSAQVTNAAGVARTFKVSDYTYDLSGNLVSETYPSGRVVKSEYDPAGRLAGVRDGSSGAYYGGGAATDAANRIAYTAAGGVSVMKLGNGLWEHTSFNSRLQPNQIGLGSSAVDSGVLKLDYSYGMLVDGTLDPTKNSGNVQGQTITGGGITLRQSYEYDELNRLKSAKEESPAGLCRDVNNNVVDCWKQTFDYDPYGNRRFKAAETTVPQITLQNEAATNPAINPANNRITSAGYRYDPAGNLECDPAHPCGQSAPYPASYLYDAENRLATYNGGASVNGGATYSYDGEGRRVKKVAGVIETVFIYDAMGQLVAEYSTEAAAQNGTRYLTADTLGTPRVVTDGRGAIVARHDYLPFGEEVGAGVGGRTQQQGYSQPSGIRQGFTGYEKDGETGLNFAQSRYYSPTQGRFTSPDQPLVDQWADAPQSWNLYAYVRNNPLNLVDPFGMAAECPRGWEGCIERDGKFYWPNPETGEEIEIDDSVIVANSAASGVPRDGGGPNLTVGEALQQQEERRSGFILNNVAAAVGYGIGKIFKGIGGLFRGSSANSAQFANGVTRAALQSAANDAGPTVQVVTRLTQAPASGRALSVAVGDGAEALAGAARSGGQTYTARIPKALIETMKSARLVEERITQMGGTRAVELRFRPEAAEFITRFFH
jgi:RHS repeat-associated protein